MGFKFDWNIYPETRISKMRGGISVRFFAVAARNFVYFLNFIAKPFFPDSEMVKNIKTDHNLTVKDQLTYIQLSLVPGVVGEFGSHGALSYIVASWLGKYDKQRNIHIFDSFEGMPLASLEEDSNMPLITTGILFEGASKTPLTVSKLHKKLARKHPKNKIHIHAGWFSNTLPKVEIEEGFALLLMDCTLYQSHRDVYFNLFSRGLVNEGALVHCNDWNLNRALPNGGSRKAWKEAVEEFNIEYSDQGPSGYLGRQFIVHCYDGIKHTPHRNSGL